MTELAVTLTVDQLTKRERNELIAAHSARALGASRADVEALLESLASWCADLGFREPAERLAAEVFRSTTRLSRRALDSGIVYVVQPSGRQFVKIGVADNLALRIQGLQTSSPEELMLLAAIPGGRRLESVLHAAFAGYRVRGEWFRLVAPIVRLAELTSMPSHAWADPKDTGEDEWRSPTGMSSIIAGLRRVYSASLRNAAAQAVAP